MNHKSIDTAKIVNALTDLVSNPETGFSPAQIALCGHYEKALMGQKFADPTAATMMWNSAAHAYCAETIYSSGASFSHEADIATFTSVARACMPEAFASEAIRILRGQAPDDGTETAIDPMVRIACALECLALRDSAMYSKSFDDAREVVARNVKASA